MVFFSVMSTLNFNILHMRKKRTTIYMILEGKLSWKDQLREYKLVCTKGDKAGRAFTLLPISPAKMN